MMLSDYHIHTEFCDGKSSAEEIVRKAAELGFDVIGFSSHGYTPYDLRYCMKDTEGYISAIGRLKEKYRDSVDVLLGVEEDCFAPVDREKFDYIIGSCHYIRRGGEYYPVDSSPQHFFKCMELFGGDRVALVESYLDEFCACLEKRRPDMIGHFDLFTKYDESHGTGFLDDVKCIRIAEEHLKELLKMGLVFEVNTGAIARGLRTLPYPSMPLLSMIAEKGGRIVLTSDCHDAANLGFAFAETRELLRRVGFKETWHFTKDGFVASGL